MEELKILSGVLKTHGVAGILALYIFWDRYVLPARRKRAGVYVSWKSLEEKLNADNHEIVACRGAIQNMAVIVEKLKDEMFKKDREMEILEITQARTVKDVDEMKYIVRDIGGNLKTNNRLLGEVKDTNVKLLDVLEAIKPKGPPELDGA